jgi:protein-disulfide isomerase
VGARRTQLIVIGVLATLIVAAAIVVSQTGAGDEAGPSGDLAADAAQVEETLADVPQSGNRLGDPDAPQTVVEFVDMQCSFCAEFARRALPEVIDQRVRTGELALELRVISFLGEGSDEAAELAAAAQLQDRLWELTELFFLNQGEEGTGYVTEEFLTELAEATPGLDADQALDERGSEQTGELLADNEAEATRLGVAATPSFVLLGPDGDTELRLSELTAEDFLAALDSPGDG